MEAILDRSNAGKRLSAVLGTHGGDRRSEQAKTDQACPDNLETKGGAEHWRRRLAREAQHDPDVAVLWERVEAGELKPTTAAKRIGWRKKPSRLEELRAAWRRTPHDDRRAFLSEIGLLEERAA